jgi:hypothetical protein
VFNPILLVFVFHNLTNNFRGLLFDHMAHDHGFNVGLPDNLGKKYDLYFIIINFIVSGMDCIVN